MRFDSVPDQPSVSDQPAVPDQPSVPDQPAKKAVPVPEAQVEAPSGRPVLVAGLDDRKRTECHAALVEAGLTPIPAKSAVDVLTEIDGGSVEAIIIDARFDEGGGREILKRLSITRRLFPCVIICDLDFPIKELPSLGLEKILTKPVQPEQLASAVNAVLT